MTSVSRRSASLVKCIRRPDLKHRTLTTFPFSHLAGRSLRMSVSTLALNDGNKVPWMAFGTGTALYRKDAEAAIRLAIDNGFTHLDGAQVYGNEDTLGDGMIASGKARSEVYITTKLTALKPGATPKSALEESLKKLKVDYVDLYLIHQANDHVGKLKEVWKGMEEAQKAGLTKSIGVSNFTADHLRDIMETATIAPAVNQVSYCES
jgi:diketogulonate reductase-like aldo/keto reductase